MPAVSTTITISAIGSAKPCFELMRNMGKLLLPDVLEEDCRHHATFDRGRSTCRLPLAFRRENEREAANGGERGRRRLRRIVASREVPEPRRRCKRRHQLLRSATIHRPVKSQFAREHTGGGKAVSHGLVEEDRRAERRRRC